MNQYEKENVDRIISEIKELEKTTKMSDAKKAYYMYVKMGDIYQYKASYKYLNYNTKEQMKIKKNLYKEGTTEEGEMICIDGNKTYVEALKMLGIEAHISSFGIQLPHVNACFKDEEGKWYYTDLTADIMHIKTGMKIRNFGLSEEQIMKKWKSPSLNDQYLKYISTMKAENEGKDFTAISEEQLKCWDNEFAYTYQGLYTNDVLDMLAKEALDDEFAKEFFGTNNTAELAQKKLDFVMQKLEIVNIHRRKEIGDVEAINYYEKIMKKILSPEEQKYVNQYKAFIEENGKRKAKDIIVIKKENENIYYMYNSKNQIFENIAIETLLNSSIKYHTAKEDKVDISVLINRLEERLKKSEPEIGF